MRLLAFAAFVLFVPLAFPQTTGPAGAQTAEGFEKTVFHHNANRSIASLDFRGMSVGSMTAGWWAPGQMTKNLVSWETAAVPAKAKTTFAFIGASAVLPSEFTRGPEARLSVDGKYALTFRIGVTRDFVWREGEVELRYVSKRVEFPYFNAHRQLELNGNSGIYRLTVPASMVEAGKPVTLQVELQPFAGWNHGWFMVKNRTDTLQMTPAIMNGELDALRRDAAVTNQQTHMLATQVYANPLGRDRFEHHVVYQNGFRHLHPADLITLQNGDLLMMTREATEHYSNDGDVVMVRSKDGGRTWGDRQVIAGLKDVDEREGCGVQLPDGTILVGIFYNNLYNPDGSYNFNWRQNLPVLQKADQGLRYLGSYTIVSRDNGRTWSAPRFIDTKAMPFHDVEGPTDAPIVMPDGTILMGVIGSGTEADPANSSAIMLRSTDQGQTWTYLSTIAADPGGKLGGFVEPGIVRTKTGRIVAALRNHGPDNAIWVTHSDDAGKTWVQVRKTEMIGHPVDLIQLKDGRLLASYGIRTPHTRPTGVRACFSRDNGETWDLATEVQLRNDFGNWDVGYPESLELADGRVLTVYYYNQFGKYFIGSTFWKPAAAPDGREK
ncbi:sialidase family protein [Horticoccus sp. 23ND18S-11]|uniref:sialidase family protein n=1 Tax=Horticoccus sp. 23ND18S-11 TaxID=3391832 RepID=UPI0039C94890